MEELINIENTEVKTILFVGNGFDLALGYKTSYKYFSESEQFRGLINNNKLAEYIYTKFQTNDCKWVDIEVELANYSNHLIELNSVNNKEENKRFKNEHQELSYRLKSYLQSENGGQSSKKMIGLRDKWLQENDFIHIINFNYTRTCETFFHKKTKRIEMRNVHGTLDYNLGNTENNTVLGIDESQKINPIHSFIYKSSNQNIDVVGLKDKINHAEKYIFFGCSMGESDEWYFKELFQTARNKSFYIYYYGSDNKISIENRIRMLSGSLHDFKERNLQVIFEDVSTT